MDTKTTLVVMAAGMGSRYGGLKQIDPVGPSGEIILDYSVYDAVQAGFDKAVFIIRRDISDDFRQVTKKRIEKMIDTEYVYQDTAYLPEGFSPAPDRKKPWGTGHALYCAKDVVKTPFAIINADDFYGRTSYTLLHNELVNGTNTCMVGFKLANTLTENGKVSRGICHTQDGYLKDITEYTALDKNSGFDPDTVVSMNMWGFTAKIFDYAESCFKSFLNNMKNPLKDEFYIPSIVDSMIKNHNRKVKVINCSEKWYGVTYKEDKPDICRAINKLHLAGYYDKI